MPSVAMSARMGAAGYVAPGGAPAFDTSTGAVNGKAILRWHKPSTLSALADGDPVTSWPDSGPSPVAATQATGASRPIYKTAILNGLAVVRFDGVDDFLTSASTYQFGPAFTVFTVSRVTGGSYPQGAINVDINPPRLLQHRYGSATSMQSIVWPGAITESEPVTAANWSVMTTVRGSGLVQAFVNGTSNGSTTAGGTPAEDPAAYITIGRAYSGSPPSGYLTGDIAEVLVYNVELDASDRAAVHTYLSDKYAITVADHL